MSVRGHCLLETQLFSAPDRILTPSGHSPPLQAPQLDARCRSPRTGNYPLLGSMQGMIY